MVNTQLTSMFETGKLLWASQCWWDVCCLFVRSLRYETMQSDCPIFPFAFTQQEVDNVLYGYIRGPADKAPAYALSGVQLGNISSGKAVESRVLRRASSCIRLGLGSTVSFGRGLSDFNATTLQNMPTLLEEWLKIVWNFPPTDRPLSENTRHTLISNTSQSQLSFPRDVVPYVPMDPEMPDGLKILESAFPDARHIGVFCCQKLISKGTRFGPFRGTIMKVEDLGRHNNDTVWEVRCPSVPFPFYSFLFFFFLYLAFLSSFILLWFVLPHCSTTFSGPSSFSCSPVSVLRAVQFSSFCVDAVTIGSAFLFLSYIFFCLAFCDFAVVTAHLKSRLSWWTMFSRQCQNNRKTKPFLRLQVFQDGELIHYVDGKNNTQNWMRHVQCARHDGEQNLILVQEGMEVFFEVSKDIYEGGELLIWYGESYLKYMGIPITMKSKIVTSAVCLEGQWIVFTHRKIT